MTMKQSLKAKYVVGDKVLVAYLDLCGTRFAYSKLALEQQMERIGQVISVVHSELDTIFGKEQKSLYVHMYADSLTAAEKPTNPIEGCATKFVKSLLRAQYQILCDSQSLEYRDQASNQKLYMPTLTRGLVMRGKYYGMLFEQSQTSMEDIFLNFSLVGGPAIVEMDKALKGLPPGVYIDTSVVREFQGTSKLVNVQADQLKFVKPCAGFDELRRMTQGKNLDDWVTQMIEASGNNDGFKSKLQAWADAVQGRLNLIKRST